MTAPLAFLLGPALPAIGAIIGYEATSAPGARPSGTAARATARAAALRLAPHFAATPGGGVVGLGGVL